MLQFLRKKYSSEEITGDSTDLVRITKQVMNRSSAKRLISKQEATVLLGNLDLVTSTESIENVSISNSKQLRKAESTSSSKNLMDAYIKRPKTQESLNLKDFFHVTKNSNDRQKRGHSFLILLGFVGHLNIQLHLILQNTS